MSATEIKLFDASGKEVGTKKVSSAIFACEVIQGLLHQVVRWQRAKRRAGTHSVKTRAQVRGGGRKPFRQKGLGRARAGSTRSPLWVGGGVAHGPKPRSYEFDLNRKEKARALCSAITSRNNEGRCIAVTDFGLTEIKTKSAKEVLAALGIANGDKALVVADVEDAHVSRSVRNLAGVKALPPEGLNVYDVLNAKYLVMTEKGLDKVEERLASKKEV